MSDAPRRRAPRVVVVGGGITGLATAHRLMQLGADVIVLERDPRPGGVVSSMRSDHGWLAEEGPTSVTMTPALWRLTRTLGLRDAVVAASPVARRRWIVRRGVPIPLPGSPFGLLRSPLLDSAASVRLLAEAMVPQGSRQATETVAAFAARRFGPASVPAIAEAMVTGIYAGDPEQLGVRYALPMVAALERAHGSVLRGAVRLMRRAVRRRRTTSDPAPRGSVSFVEGMQSLPAGLAARLGSRVRCGIAVNRVAPRAGGGWRITADSGDGGSSETIEADAVVLAVPAHGIPSLGLPAMVDADVDTVAGIVHASLGVITLGFAREDVAHPLDGFGMLSAPREGGLLRGVLFPGTLFPGRAPAGSTVLACFVGGVARASDATADPNAMLPALLRELNALVGVRGTPRFMHAIARPRAIPQPGIAHGGVIAAANRVEDRCAGLVLAGSWRDGVAVGRCVAGGEAAAARAYRAALEVADGAPVRALEAAGAA